MPTTNLTTLFSDIADAIRGKDGTSATITASDFPARITAIPSGGGKVTISLTGNLQNLDFQGQWDSVFNNNDIELEFTNVSNMASAFTYSKLTTVDLTGATYKDDANNSGMVGNLTTIFNNCLNLTEVRMPGLVGTSPTALNAQNSMFSYCGKLKTIYMPDFVTYGASSMFNNCHSLRQIPFTILSGQPYINAPSGTIYSSGFYSCNVLDEITDLGVVTLGAGSTIGQLNSNAFSMFCHGDYRLKRITFATDNGNPKVANWKNQTITITNLVGYANNVSNITNYGISIDKRVTDSTSYNALKNDPDWFTTDIAYSRYNHDSAVETINSLPDTSAYIATAGGTNTIQFVGASGSATDGGAINTLTSAEIAVATAKGWTVTF